MVSILRTALLIIAGVGVGVFLQTELFPVTFPLSEAEVVWRIWAGGALLIVLMCLLFIKHELRRSHEGQ